MKLIFKFTILLQIIFLLLPNWVIAQNNYKIKTIVIDAGHGGKDPGALGSNSKEKNLALAIALKLGKYIKTKYPNINVIYTRTTDVFIELHKRSQIANDNNANLFISIHINASHDKSVKGTACYVMGLNKVQDNLDVAKRENAVILIEDDYKKQYEGYDPNSPESDIIMSLYQNAYLHQSISLAGKVQKQFTLHANRKGRGVRQAGLVVLWNCSMPGILVESGFISNKEEEKYMMSDYGQSILASAIYRAFSEYKNEVEGTGNNIVNENKVKPKKEPIVFKVQIGYSTRKLETKAKNFRGLENVQREYDGKKYSYTIGNTSSYHKILKLQSSIRKTVPDAYVIAFKNNKKISVKQAVKELNKK